MLAYQLYHAYLHERLGRYDINGSGHLKLFTILKISKWKEPGYEVEKLAENVKNVCDYTMLINLICYACPVNTFFCPL